MYNTQDIEEHLNKVKAGFPTCEDKNLLLSNLLEIADASKWLRSRLIKEAFAARASFIGLKNDRTSPYYGANESMSDAYTESCTEEWKLLLKRCTDYMEAIKYKVENC